jgi:hypothetical protein
MSVPIYRYHAEQSDGWRFLYSTNSNFGQGWTYDGIAFYAPTQDDPWAIPIYQFHYDQNATYGGLRFHFSTDKNSINDGWTYDGSPFKVYNAPIRNSVPIYVYHVVQSDGWRFLLTTGENAKHGWIKDGVAFYANPGQIN